MTRIHTMLPAVALVLVTGVTCAAPVQFQFASTVAHVEGSYVGALSGGMVINGTYVFDADTANAGPDSDPNPSFEPGHEYSSFWDFPGAPYVAELFAPALNAGFTNEAPVSVVVNNDLPIDAEQTGGMVPTGTYDWIELLASNTVDACNPQCRPADGEEWSLAIFAATDWIGSDDQIPHTLPAAFSAFLIGIEFDSVGTEIGVVLAPVDSLSLTSVPVPAALWLFGSALALVGWRGRRER